MKRGHFLEDYKGPITFEILLSKMVSCLQDDLAAETSAKLAVSEKEKLGDVKDDGTVETLAEKLARKKAERKREAEERSRIRQEERGYFKEKEKLNVEAVEKKKEKMEERKIIGEVEDGEKEEETEQTEEEGDGKTKDPFGLKFRSKIGGRYS